MARISKAELENRRKEILEEICKNEEVQVGELAERFNTSNMTIWRDLEHLEKHKYIRKTNNGKVKKNDDLSLDPSIYNRSKENHTKKVAIALKACEMIEDGDVLGFDASSTTMELAKLLFMKNNLTIVSNNMLFMPILYDHPSIRVIFAGGNLMMKGYSTEGELAVNTFNQFIYDKIFISANAVDVDFGLSNIETFETGTKKVLIKNAKKKIVLADSTKIGNLATFKCCDMEDIDVLITNDDADKEVIQEIKNKGIEVILC